MNVDSLDQRVEAALGQRTRYLAVVAEDLYQPHNAAAVVRACECFGVQDLHVISNRNVFRIEDDQARLAAETLTIRHYNHEGADNTRICLESLKRQGYRIVATTLRGDSAPLGELPLDCKTALCFGAEEPGLSDQAHDLADLRVFLPMHGFTQSFNISVSAAICLDELTERLRREGRPWPLDGAARRELRAKWRAASAASSPQAPVLSERY